MARLKRGRLLAPLGAILLLGGSTAGAQDLAAGPGLVVYNPANHHYYQCISVPDGIKWTEAKDAAAKRVYKGVHGHLVTILDQQVHLFLYNYLRLKDYWGGAFQDHKAPDFKEPAGGWYWVTGEPMKFTSWNPNEPNNSEADSEVLQFWGDGSTWNDQNLSAKMPGYVVEFPTPAEAKEQPTPGQLIGQVLNRSLKAYKSLTSYSARIEMVVKAHIDTVDTVKAEFTFAPPNRFRLEGRGEKGKVLVVSDGKNLTLSTTAPGENTNYLVKPLTDLSKALTEAFSLITSAPRLPGVVNLITGTLDTKLWMDSAVLGELVEGETPKQAIRGRFSMKIPGEDPIEGNAALFLEPDSLRAVSSELEFRFKLYPFNARETHTNIKVNQPLPDGVFTFVPPTGAKQVNDLGEGDDNEVEFTPKKKR